MSLDAALILSLASLAPAAAPPIDGPACVLVREFPLRIKRRGVEMKLVIDGPGATATAPDPVLLKAIKRAHRCSMPWTPGVSVRWRAGKWTARKRLLGFALSPRQPIPNRQIAERD
ncbi:MAG TPA: hypothetical protein VFX06_14500 [Stellaceae bacterium]|nr:hypothetical protein [Stellaceae bacterium]